MPTPEIEEFAKLLVENVRDAAVRNCDGLLQPHAPVARRWRDTGAAPTNIAVVLPDAVDEVVFSLLQAIDQGAMRLKFVTSAGTEVDLTEEGLGELPVGTWAAVAGARCSRRRGTKMISRI